MNTNIPTQNSRSQAVVELTTSNSAGKGNSAANPAQPAQQVEATPVNPLAKDVAATEQKEKPSLQEVIEISARLQDSVQTIRRDLNFSVDETLGDIVITVTDRETQETIRQIPSEEVLSISRNIEEVKSLLFDKIKA